MPGGFSILRQFYSSSARHGGLLSRSRLTRELKCLSVLHLGHIQPSQYTHSPAGFWSGEVPQHGMMAVARFFPNSSCAHAVPGQQLKSTFCCVHLPLFTFDVCGEFLRSMAGAEGVLIFEIFLPVVLHCATLTALLAGAAWLIHCPAADARPLHRLPLCFLGRFCASVGLCRGSDCGNPGKFKDILGRPSGLLGVDCQGGQRRLGIKFDGFPWLVHDAAFRIPTFRFARRCNYHGLSPCLEV